MNKRIISLLAIIILMASPLDGLAQQKEERAAGEVPAVAAGEVLTLEEAISLALRDKSSRRSANPRCRSTTACAPGAAAVV